MSWSFLDFVYFPWTINKYLWEKFVSNPKDANRPPQTSCAGRPLALAYGRVRMTGNLIIAGRGQVATLHYTDWFENLSDVFARNHWQNQYGLHPIKYVWPRVVALCEGEISTIERVWLNNDVKPHPGDWGLEVFTGTRPTQTAWTGLDTAERFPYPGVAYVATFGVTSGVIDKMSFEVHGRLAATGNAQGDADPSLVVEDLVNDEAVGAGAPFDVEYSLGLDGTVDSSANRYLTANGFWLSPLFSDQRPAAEHARDLLSACNCTVLWTADGKLLVVPLGDARVDGNSVTYLPADDIRYAIGTDNLVGGTRIEMEVAPASEAFNVCPVEFLNRWPKAAEKDPGYAYNAEVVEDPEPIDETDRGQRRAPNVQMHSICLQDIALRISRIRAQQSVRLRSKYKFKLPWNFALLECLDLVSLTEPRLGLNQQPAQITKIEEDQGILSIEAVEWTAGVSHAHAHTVSSSDSGGADMSDGRDPVLNGHYLAMQNWRLGTMPTAQSYSDVAYGNGWFVAVGQAGTVSVSRDGVTWTAVTLTGVNADCVFSAVVYTGSRWLATGFKFTSYTPVVIQSLIATNTTDPATGSAWTVTANSFGAVGLTDAVYNGADVVLLASAWGGDPSYTYKSTDGGATWGSQVAMPSSVVYNALAWMGQWVAVGNNGASAVSSAATSWAAAGTIPPGTAGADFSALGTDGSRLLAVGTDGLAAYSDDGATTWTAVSIPYEGSAPWLVAVLWTGRLFVVVDSLYPTQDSTIYLSPDGIGWESVETGVTVQSGYSFAACFGGRMAVVIGNWESGGPTHVVASMLV